MIQAVIFDFDGVLVDSHGTINQVFTRTVNEMLGLNITEKDFARFPGLRFEKRMAILAKEKNITITDEQITQARKAGIDEYRSNSSLSVKLYPGVLRLLNELKANNIKIGLGSNGSRKTIERIMDNLNIRSYFDSLVGYDDVTHGKPAPDMFLKNAKNFNIKPQDCAVIEDSIEGITAAKAANMKAVALLTTTSRENLNSADLILNSINDLNMEKIQKL